LIIRDAHQADIPNIIEGIKDFVGGRVVDRLLENGTVLEFTWDSYRIRR
jgi:DNA replication protein DnaC